MHAPAENDTPLDELELVLATTWDLQGLTPATRRRIDRAARSLGAELTGTNVTATEGPTGIADGIDGAVAVVCEARAEWQALFPAELTGRDLLRIEVRHRGVALPHDQVATLAAIAAVPFMTLFEARGGGGTRFMANGAGAAVAAPFPEAAEIVAAAAVAFAVLVRDAARTALPDALTRHPRVLEQTAEGTWSTRAWRRDGAPMLRRGRLTRLRGETGSGTPLRLWAQQATAALLLYVRADLELLAPAHAAAAARRLRGEAPTPLDDPRTDLPVAASLFEPQPLGTGVANGGSTVAFITLGPSTPTEWRLPTEPPKARPALMTQGILRTARAVSHVRPADVVVCPWHQIDLIGHDVRLRGPFLAVRDGRVEGVVPESPAAPSAMLFYPVAHLPPPGATLEERDALDRLVAMGVVGRRPSRQGVVAQLLREAAQRGVVTNVTGLEGLWWRKDMLELALRAFTRATGRVVRRPETYVAAAPHLSLAISGFHRDGRSCLVKPAGGARAEGIEIVRPGDVGRPTYPWGQYVVQELVEAPLCAEGRKIDLRYYVVIDTFDRSASGRIGPVLARSAGAPYAAGVEAAEITSTSFKMRLGFGPSIAPLEDLTGIDRDIADAVRDRVDELTNDFLDALFWWTQWRRETGNVKLRTRRVLLWGLDAIPHMRDGAVEASLLEANVFPLMYRGDRKADRAVERMVVEEYLPAVLRARVAHPATRTGRRATLLTTRLRHRTAAGLVKACAARGLELVPSRSFVPGSVLAFHWGLDHADLAELLASAADECARAGADLVNGRLISKWSQLRELRAAGISVPRSRLVRTREEADGAARILGYPVVLKPNFGSYSRGVVVVPDRRRLLEAWEPRHRIVQTFLGDGFRCARLLVIGDRVTHGVVRVALDGFLATYDHGRRAALEPLQLTDELERLAVEAARTVDIDIAGVDVVQTATGPVVLEVNHRGVEFHDHALHGADAVEQVAGYLADRARRTQARHLEAVAVT